MMNSRSLLSLVATIIVFFGATITASADLLSYPATACRPWYYAQGIAHYGENGRVSNEHTTERMTLVCPVNEGGQDTHGFVDVRARDQHPLQAVECAMYMQYNDSDSRFWSNIGATTGAGESVRVLQNWNARMGSLSCSGSNCYFRYYTYVVCSLPPKYAGLTSMMSNYYVDRSL